MRPLPPYADDVGMPSSVSSSLPRPEHLDVTTRGSIPRELSGRLVGIGNDQVVRSVLLRPGQTPSYQTQQLGTDTTLRNVLAFGGITLVLGDDSPAYELSAQLDTFGVVDLAGQDQAVAAFPKHDVATGELHLVAHTQDGTQSHVIVTAGALTRRRRPILHTPQRITDLALTSDSVVFVADGFVGITPREGDARTTWMVTEVADPHLVHAHDAGGAIVVLVVTPTLERWTLHAGARTVEREVLDPTPRRFAHLIDNTREGALRWAWTTGDATIGRHDLVDSRNVHHFVTPSVPGDFAVVPDAARPDDTGGGWLIGFIHSTAGATTDLRVIDAADPTAPAVLTVRIPHRIPPDLRCAWIPSAQH
jgi:carotenoid cleavage dioxygenase-like enzyme